MKKLGLIELYCEQKMGGSKNRDIRPLLPTEIRFADGIDHCVLIGVSRLGSLLLDILKGILIAAFNMVAMKMYIRYSGKQYHQTKIYQFTYEIKSSLKLMFFNTVIVLYLSNVKVESVVNIFQV